MYSSFQLIKKYLHYFFTASNSKGHGIHSPFVFDFTIHVLNDKKKYSCYQNIESLRRDLLHNDSIIEVEDFGAGSATIPFKKRKINAIAKSSLKNKKFAQLLFRMVQYYQPQTILEIGTSLGITTCYLASANKNATVYTFEGSENIATIAEENFEKANLENIHLIKGNFDQTLLPALQSIEKIDFAFIDGNHRKAATLSYFFSLLKKSTSQSVFIFDDIHWSAEMEEAWKLIQQHDSVTLIIDLFFIGIVFFNPGFKVKQHFSIRF
jgi:predicted O-methyltransferase YrrM